MVAGLLSHSAGGWVHPPEEMLPVADSLAATLSTQGKAEDGHQLSDERAFLTLRTALTVKPPCS